MTPSLDDLQRLGRALNLRAEVVDRLFQQARAERLQAASRTPMGPVLGQSRILAAEEKSASIWTICTNVIPALLQTPNYSQALFAKRPFWWDEAHDAEQLLLRAHRRAQLCNLSKNFRFIIFESALYEVSGDHETMIEQLVSLPILTNRQNIELRILAAQTKKPLAPCTFVVTDKKMVSLDVLPAPEHIYEPYEVEFYSNLFEEFWDLAFEAPATGPLIEKAISHFRTPIDTREIATFHS